MSKWIENQNPDEPEQALAAPEPYKPEPWPRHTLTREEALEQIEVGRSILKRSKPPRVGPIRSPNERARA